MTAIGIRGQHEKAGFGDCPNPAFFTDQIDCYYRDSTSDGGAECSRRCKPVHPTTARWYPALVRR